MDANFPISFLEWSFWVACLYTLAGGIAVVLTAAPSLCITVTYSAPDRYSPFFSIQSTKPLRNRSCVTVSESHTTAQCRFARVTATFNLRSSRKNPIPPIPPRALLLTRLITTASRSPPWNPSTDRISSFGTSGRSIFRKSSTWPLYGVITAISSARRPSASNDFRCDTTIFASPSLYLDPASFAVSYMSHPAVSIRSSVTFSKESVSTFFTSLTFAFIVSATSGSVTSFLFLTESWLTSFPLYIALLAQLLISWCIRYCTSSIFERLPPSIFSYAIINRSNRVLPSSFCTSRAGHLIVGGNCLWSPASTARFPFSKLIQQLASSACAASSIITKSNDSASFLSPNVRFKREPAAPIFVARTTLDSCNICPTTFSSRLRISRRTAFISRYASLFSFGRDFALDKVFKYPLSSARQSFTISVPSDDCTSDSREYCWMPRCIRAGWPSRTAFIFFFVPKLRLVPMSSFSMLMRRSKTLSTATLLGAVTRTFHPL